MPNTDLGTAEGKIVIDSSGVESGVDQANNSLGRLGKGQANTADTLQKTGASLLGIGGVAVAAFGLAVNSAADFESQLSGIKAVSQGTEEEMERVRAKALQLGADTAFSAGEAAGAIEELSRRGISLEEVLGGAADATVALAAATGTDLATSATIASNAMNVFGIKANELDRVTNQIAGFDVVGSSVEDFGMALTQSGAVADLVGLSFEDLTTSIAAMSKAGINSSDAGTSIKTFLNNLQPTTEKQIKLARELGIVTEDNTNRFYTAEGNLKSMSEVAGVLSEAVGGLTAQERQMALETLFGSDAIRAAAVIAEEGSAGFDALATQIGSVDAADQAATRMDNLSGSIEQLKGSVETYLIGAGTPFLASVRSIVDAFTNLVNFFGELPAPIQKLIGQFVLISGVLLVGAGGITFFLGTFLKFANTLKAFTGLFNLAKGAEGAAKSMRILNATFLANPVFLIVAAVVALGVALFILYKKSETFRNFVNGLWDSIKKAWSSALDFFRSIPEFFSAIFEKIMNVINGFKAFWNSLWSGFSEDEGTPVEMVAIRIHDAFERLVNFFKDLPDKIIGAIKDVVGAITKSLGQVLDAVVGFLTELPGVIAKGLIKALKEYVKFWLKLPERSAYALGRVIGTWTRFHISLIKLVIKTGIAVVGAVIDFAMKLPGILLGFATKMINVWIDFHVALIKLVIETFTRVVTFAIEKLTQFVTWLPGFLLGILTKFIAWGVELVGWAASTFLGLITTIVNILVALPGKVLGFFLNIITALPGLASSMFAGAKDIGQKAIDGLTGVLTGLAGLVKDMVLGAINGVGSLAQTAYDKMKSVGSSMWNGFKDGLGINSPSFVEKAAFSMNENVATAINTLGQQVKSIQGLGRTMPGVAGNEQISPMAQQAALRAAPPMSPTDPAAVAPTPGMTVNGPLIGQANIRSDQDIVALAEELDRVAARKARARGRED